jgi:hypothetical protein
MRSIIADEMKTNALNSIWMNFFQRQLNALTSMIDHPSLVRRMIVLINCSRDDMSSILSKWKTKVKRDAKKLKTKGKTKLTKGNRLFKESVEKLDDEWVQKIIEEHRRCVRDFDPKMESKRINENYAKTEKYAPIILRYYYFLLKPLILAKYERKTRGMEQKEIKEPEQVEVGMKEMTYKQRAALEPFKSKSKVFHLLPLHHYSRFCIQIQHKIIVAISKRIGCAHLIDNKDVTAVWNNWFDLKNLRIPKNRPLIFTRILVTNGVKVSCPFKEVSYSEMDKCDGKPFVLEKKSRKPKKVKYSFSSPSDEPPKPVPFLPGQNGIFYDETGRLPPNYVFDPEFVRGVVVDPGRDPTVTAMDFSPQSLDDRKKQRWSKARSEMDGKRTVNPMVLKLREEASRDSSHDGIRTFSSGEFYHWRKTNVNRNRLAHHKKKFMESNAKHRTDFMQVSSVDFRTDSAADFKRSWIQRLEIEETLWAFYGRKEHARRKFDAYRAKQSTERRICLRILGLPDDSKIQRDLFYIPPLPTLVAYGDGNFKTNVKGNKTTPVKAIPKRLAQFPGVTVVMTGEFRTSICCHKCKRKMKKKLLWSWKRTRLKQWRMKKNHMVFKRKHELVFEKCFKVLHCAEQCINAKGIHRDVNACYNIAEVCYDRIRGQPTHPVFSRKQVDEAV